MTACQLLSHVFLNFFGLWFWFLRYFGALSNHTNSFIDFMSQQVWRLLGGRTWTYLSFSVPQSLFFFFFVSLASKNTEWQWFMPLFVPFFPSPFLCAEFEQVSVKWTSASCCWWRVGVKEWPPVSEDELIGGLRNEHGGGINFKQAFLYYLKRIILYM